MLSQLTGRVVSKRCAQRKADGGGVGCGSRRIVRTVLHPSFTVCSFGGKRPERALQRLRHRSFYAGIHRRRLSMNEFQWSAMHGCRPTKLASEQSIEWFNPTMQIGHPYLGTDIDGYEDACSAARNNEVGSPTRHRAGIGRSEAHTSPGIQIPTSCIRSPWTARHCVSVSQSSDICSWMLLARPQMQVRTVAEDTG